MRNESRCMYGKICNKWLTSRNCLIRSSVSISTIDDVDIAVGVSLYKSLVYLYTHTKYAMYWIEQFEEEKKEEERNEAKRYSYILWFSVFCQFSWIQTHKHLHNQHSQHTQTWMIYLHFLHLFNNYHFMTHVLFREIFNADSRKTFEQQVLISIHHLNQVKLNREKKMNWFLSFDWTHEWKRFVYF